MVAVTCYISMPFGQKPMFDGQVVNFEEIYARLIKPAVEREGYQPVHLAEQFSNEAIMDFTTRLIADSEFMIADISLNNPNVIYELGIRHAFVPSGTLIMRLRDGSSAPFDLSNMFRHEYTYPLPTDDAGLEASVSSLGYRIRQVSSAKTSNAVYRKGRHSREYEEYREALDEFQILGSYEQSVFIMTKYPEPDPTRQTDRDKKLQRVINTVRCELRARNLVPRVARERPYHSMIWKNVEVHLLGCSKGVAVVENKYGNEVNPNIAMEWGWMRSQKKDVLYLLENDFRNERADFSGFLCAPFSWDYPEEGIKAAVDGWLGQSGAAGL